MAELMASGVYRMFNFLIFYGMINYSLVKRYAKVGDENSTLLTYGTAQTVKTLSLTEFSKHIAEHGSVYGRSDVQAILTMAVDCLREMLLNGYKVSLGDLGDFAVSLRGKGVADANNYNPSVQVKKVRVIWSPGELFRNLVEDAEYSLVPTLRERAALLKAVKAGETMVDISRPAPINGTSGTNTGSNTGSGSDTGGTTGNGTNTGGDTGGGNDGSGNGDDLMI